jgi:hypothetical protein
LLFHRIWFCRSPEKDESRIVLFLVEPISNDYTIYSCFGIVRVVFSEGNKNPSQPFPKLLLTYFSQHGLSPQKDRVLEPEVVKVPSATRTLNEFCHILFDMEKAT